jgi:thiamine-phosphate pyrophosphorylase
MLRILDANFNRLGEGLRVLEDIARFYLNDAELSGKLKEMRHKLLPHSKTFQQQLLEARDSEGDVAAFAEAVAERDNILGAVTANAKRAEESLRVLAEMSTLYQGTLDRSQFEHARFALYELEQRLALKLLRKEKAEKISGLYVIIDTQVLRGRSVIDVAHGVIRGGAKVLQLRDKQRSKRELLPLAQDLNSICVQTDIPFVVNDHLDVALATDADGLHIGQEDLPLTVARQILPPDKFIGCSAATLKEAIEAEADGADYIAVGSIYETPSKPEARLAGVETLRQVKKAISVPVVAIGGINEDRLAEVLAAGADAIAVISAVLGADDVEQAAQQLADKIKAVNERMS